AHRSVRLTRDQMEQSRTRTVGTQRVTAPGLAPAARSYRNCTHEYLRRCPYGEPDCRLLRRLSESGGARRDREAHPCNVGAPPTQCAEGAHRYRRSGIEAALPRGDEGILQRPETTARP